MELNFHKLQNYSVNLDFHRKNELMKKTFLFAQKKERNESTKQTAFLYLI
jgi:hypothetical protein